MSDLGPHVLHRRRRPDVRADAVLACSTENGYDAAALSTGATLVESTCATRPVDLLLLDLSLPGRERVGSRIASSGPRRSRTCPFWRCLRQLRGRIGQGAAASERRTVIAKPVRVRELLARIRAISRRARAEPGPRRGAVPGGAGGAAPGNHEQSPAAGAVSRCWSAAWRRASGFPVAPFCSGSRERSG